MLNDIKMKVACDRKETLRVQSHSMFLMLCFVLFHAVCSLVVCLLSVCECLLSLPGCRDVLRIIMKSKKGCNIATPLSAIFAIFTDVTWSLL